MAKFSKKFFSRIGVRKIDVPNLSGLTKEQSETVLTAVGLSWIATPSNTENININLNIVDQGTPAGTTVLPGHQVPFTKRLYCRRCWRVC